MKTKIQEFKESFRQWLKDNPGETNYLSSSLDYIAIELKEKDEEGNNYIIHIEKDSTAEEVREFLATPNKDIKSVQIWISAGPGCYGGDETIITSNEVISKCTIRPKGETKQAEEAEEKGRKSVDSNDKFVVSSQALESVSRLSVYPAKGGKYRVVTVSCGGLVDITCWNDIEKYKNNVSHIRKCYDVAHESTDAHNGAITTTMVIKY